MVQDLLVLLTQNVKNLPKFQLLWTPPGNAHEGYFMLISQTSQQTWLKMQKQILAGLKDDHVQAKTGLTNTFRGMRKRKVKLAGVTDPSVPYIDDTSGISAIEIQPIVGGTSHILLQVSYTSHCDHARKKLFREMLTY